MKEKKPLLCKLSLHRWDYSPQGMIRYCMRIGCNARQGKFPSSQKWFTVVPLLILVVAACVMAQKDSITTLASPLTQISVLKVQVQGYDASKVYLSCFVDKQGNVTACIAQDMLPYFEKDTVDKLLYHPQGVNLRWTLKDFGKDSTIVNAVTVLMVKKVNERVLLK
jgi:hypothetical protein